MQSQGLFLDILKDQKIQGAAIVASAAAISAERIRALGLGASASVNRAMQEPAGDYSLLTGTKRGLEVSLPVAALNEELSKTPAHATKASKTLKVFEGDLRDAHSAARGLASGFGAMWLTWGNIAPLLAGAAISAGFVQTLKLGAEVQDLFTKLRVLGGESSDTVAGLNKQMLELATTGPAGPRNIAEAMKTLTLAGLNAKEVSASIKDVLNFSVVGELGLKEAAESVTTIATAFNVSAENYSYVTDIISKAAAESKSSVEGMTEAFKTASVINQQYGVTLEDTAVGLALLANAGIKGTAAGTALRNMYADLSGHTKKASDQLKELGVQALDPLTGKMRSTAELFKELMKSLSESKTPIGAVDAIQNIFGERGGKLAVSILNSLKAEMASTGKSYDELLEKINNAAGFAAIAAAEIGLSPLNQMKEVTATLQSTMVSTFDSLAPYLTETANKLKEIFSSDSFKGALESLVVGVGKLTVFVLEHGKEIASVLLAYVGFRAIVGTIGALSVAYAGLAAVTATATGAVTALGVASRVATLANPLLLVLTGLITTAAGGWAMYQLWKGKADGAVDTGFATNDKLIERLEKEAIRLENINTARRRKISLELLEAEISAGLAGAQARTPVDSAQVEVNRIKAEAQKPGADRPLVKAALARELVAADAALYAAKDRYGTQLLVIDQMKDRVKTAGAEIAKAERDKPTTNPFKGLDNGGKDKGSGAVSTLKVLHDNELEQIVTRYSQELSVVKDAESSKKRLLQASQDGLGQTRGAFYALEIEQAVESEANQLAVIASSTAAYQAEYTKRNQILRDAYAQAVAGIKVKKGGKDFGEQEAELAKSLANELDKLSGKYDTTMEKFNSDQSKAENGALTRQKLVVIATAVELEKLAKSSRDFWRAEAESEAKATRSSTLEDRLRYASPQARAYLSATAAETERLTAKVLDYDRTLEEAQKTLQEFQDTLTAGAVVTDETILKEQGLIRVIQAHRLEREKTKNSIDGKSEAAGLRASVKQAKDEVAELSKSAATALVDNLFNERNGEKAAIKLREIIVKRLQEPVTIFVTAAISDVIGDIYGLLGVGGSKGPQGPGGLGNLGSLSSLGNLASAFTVGKQVLSGTMSASNGLATISANSAGTGLEGLLGESAFGTAPGFGVAYPAGTAALSAGSSLAAGVVGESAATGAMLAADYGVTAAVLEGSIATTSLTAATTGLTAALAAIPVWGWVALGAAVLLGSGGGFKSSASTGSSASNFDAAGKLTDYNTAYGGSNKATDDVVKDLQKVYSESARSLGITAVASSFNYGGNTGAEGENPQFALGSSAGGKTFYQGETKLSDAALALAASRAVFSALQGSDLPKYLAGIFDGIDASTQTQEQLTAVLNSAQSFKTLHDQLKDLPFEQLKDLSYAAAKGLVAAAGGMDKLGAGLSSYYENFYSGAEKAANTTKNVTKVFTDLGIPMLDMSAGADAVTVAFRTLVDGAMSDTSEAGQKTAAALLGVSGALGGLVAASRTNSVDSSQLAKINAGWQDKLNTLLGKQTERSIALRDAADDSTRALMNLVYAQEDLKKSAEDTAAAYVAAAEAQKTAAATRLSTVTEGASGALAGLQRAVAAQKVLEQARFNAQKEAATAIYKAQSSAIQTSMDVVKLSIDTVGASVGKLRTLAGSLKSTLDGMRIIGSEGAYRAEAQGQISSALAKAKAGGGLPLEGQLDSALRTVSQPSEQLFSSFTDYARDFYRTANDISSLSDLTGSQLTSEEASLAALKAQSDLLSDQQKTLKDGFADQVSALDDILTNAQLQLDMANGINTSVLSVSAALAEFNQTILGLTTERAKQDLATSRGTSYSSEEIIGGVKKMLESGATASQIYETGARDYGLSASTITTATTGQGLLGFDTATGIKKQAYSQEQIVKAIRDFMAAGASIADVYRVGGTDYGLSPSEIATAARAAGIPGFAGGGDHVGGLRMVGEREPELEATGPSRIWNQAQLGQALNGGSQNNARLEALIERLTQQMEELQKSSERGNAEIKRGSDALNGRQGVPILVTVTA